MTARQAIVASGHALVSEAALSILARGGNAYDAVVAAGFVSSVAEPALTSLGGGGFLLARTADHESILFDFFTDTPGQGLAPGELDPHFFPVTVHFPGSDQDFNIGMGSVAVPGNLMGFLQVHARLGKLPLEKILSPAIQAARQGIIIQSRQAHFLALLHPIMTLSPEGRRLYTPRGRFIAEGDRFKNPDLADFLERLPKDRGTDFYEGALAEQIARDMEENRIAPGKNSHGLLTAEDLHSYRVRERRPLAARYRDRTLLTNPPPSSGGTLIAKALELLKPYHLSRMAWGSGEHLAALFETMRTVDRQRTPEAGGRKFSRGTTHISVVDASGNVASMTTSNGEGSGYIVPGTGIMLNNMMGEDDLHPEGFHASPPGERISSMMSPSVMLRDNRVKLVLGSGGSKRIRTAIFQVISHMVDFGLPVRAAVNAPRLHWDGITIQIEPGFGPEALLALRDLAPLNIWPDLDVYFGGVHAVVPGESGAGDPRRDGDARSISRPSVV